ncbi:MAG: hypothetical protein ABF242_11305 [Flavobacteriales bacterium]
MSEIKVRPRIREEVALRPDEVRKLLIAHEQFHLDDFTFSKRHNHCTIDIHPVHQHYWSPHASFNLEETADGTIVRGIVGPKPNLWATFMVIYVFGLAGFTICAVIGSGMLSLGKSGLLLYISPLFLLIFLGAYVASQIGKNKAANQTQQIKDFIKEALGKV